MPPTEDAAYRRFVERTQSGESSDDLQEGLGEWFGAALPDERGHVLDYGAGPGNAVAWLRASGFERIDAYEPNPAFGERLRRFDATVHDDPDYTGFLEQITGRYDLIFCKDVLEHIPKDQIVETARRLHDGLREGGQIIVSVPHAVSFIGVYTRYDDFTHQLVFTAGSLRYVLEAAGFIDVTFFGPRFRFKLSPITMAYRIVKWFWFLTLRLIYYIENPGSPNRPPHFYPRLVARARRGPVDQERSSSAEGD